MHAAALEDSHCARCGATTAPALLGPACPACWLNAARPRRIGGYELFGRLGEGGMGEVHLAQHVDAEVPVALKLAKAQLASTPAGAASFIQEIKTWSMLVHPNIARVYASGFHDGQPFLVMELLEGGALREDANRAKYAAPRSALDLLIKIARAVQFAHRRGVLHCDLKPANILFDGDGNPHVCDFGLARRLDLAGSAPAAMIGGGTIGWMSPEQAAREPLMMASDVFSLGVLAYWLIHEELPFGEGDDYLERVRRGLPPARKRWSPRTAAALDAVSRRALRFDPDERYPSAAALADELERIQADVPLDGHRTPPWGRAWHWSNRHRMAKWLIPPFFAIAAGTLLGLEGELEKKLEGDALQVNSEMAAAQAVAVLFQLERYGDMIEKAARDSNVVDLLAAAAPRVSASPMGTDNPCSRQPALLDPAALAPYAGPFDTLVVLNEDGCMRARWAHEPPPPGLEKLHFELEDYFGGARESCHGAQSPRGVRYVYQSSISRRIKLGVSLQLCAGERRIGVLAGGINVASTLDFPPIKRVETKHRMTAVVGLFEGDQGSVELPDSPEFTFLYHRRLDPGRKVTLPSAYTERLHASFGRRRWPDGQHELDVPLAMSDYVDPLEGDRWLAAFAPIPSTGHLVVVQTRRSHALRASHAVLQLAVVAAAAFILSVLALGLFAHWNRRRDCA